MSTVWKFPLRVTGEQHILLPKDATILCVQTQHGNPALWAKFHSNIDPPLMEDRCFIITGTGHELPEGNLTYLGTFQLQGGNFVGHVWEKT